MDIKQIRQKGFEFFESNGKMPSELLINRDNLNKLLVKKDADVQLTPEECYYDDLLIVIDDSIEGFEVRYNNE